MQSSPPAPPPSAAPPSVPPTFAEELAPLLYPQTGVGLPAGLLLRLAGSYETTLRLSGATPSAVLWNGRASQRMRERQLLRLLEGAARWRRGTTVNDLGCGYGSLWRALRHRWCLRGGAYYGYDLCPAMIRAARLREVDSRARFILAAAATETADYSFASGTFGLKLDMDNDAWRDYIRATLHQLAGKTRHGLGFNLLNARHADAVGGPGRKDTLYYGDPEDWLDFCRTAFGPRVRLLDRYTPVDFTLLVTL